MPYKDPQRKREWEQRHRRQRVARRCELRRFQAAREAAQSAPQTAEMGAGGLTLLLPAHFEKSWLWWVVGTIILVIGFFFRRNNKNEKK
jgi:hypothetical protein